MTADEQPVEGPPVEALLAAGESLIADAKATIAELDSVLNTAVLPIVELPVDGDTLGD